MKVDSHNLWTNNKGFYISTNKKYLDTEVIYQFLSQESYWVNGIARELVIAAIENSILCYGIYEGNPATGDYKQVGFARVVSDLVRFSWLGDVFVLPENRGKGLSKWLMSLIVEHPNLKGTKFSLGTRDAHTLYAQFGFKPLENIESKMERPFDWDAIYAGYHLINKVKK